MFGEYFDLNGGEAAREVTNLTYGFLRTEAEFLPKYVPNLRAYLRRPQVRGLDVARSRAYHILQCILWGIANPTKWDAMLIPKKCPRPPPKEDDYHGTKHRRH